MTAMPKPLFPYIGRLYAAVVEAGVSPGSLNRENADTIMRKLVKTEWLKGNEDLQRLWILGGDNWGDTIKAVKSYSSQVNQAKREEAKRSKAAKSSNT